MNKKLIKSGLLTTLGVVSATIPLATVVSCGKAGQEQQDSRGVGSEYDKEYGVDEAVYEKLKSSFVSQATAGLTKSEAINVKRSLNKTFNLYDAKMDEMNLSYTAISNGLIEYAARVYPNVKLVRETTKKTVKWDDLTVEFEGMKNSMKAYMDNLGIHGDDQNPFLEEADRVFNGTADTARYPGIVKTVKTKYHDPLMGLMQAKAQMLQCFEAVDEKIGLVGASIRLGQFFENHEIIYNKGTNDDAANKFDNMKKTWLKEETKGTSIHEHIADIFEIKNKTTGETLKTFNPEGVCPGYIVKPILKGWTEDPIKNEYNLIIDWTCISAAHKDSANAELATAHSHNGETKHNYCFEESDFDFEAYLHSLNETSGISYNVILSRQGEIDALKSTYFNNDDEHIVFDWKASEKQFNALDAFFFGDRRDDRLDKTKRKYNLDTRTLAMTGLNIGTKDGSQNAYELTRLDNLMQTSVIDEEEKQNIKNELINDFLENCTIWSNVDVTLNAEANDIEEEMKASLYAQYSNSSYENEDEEYEEKLSIKDIGLQSTDFVISEKSYHYLTEEYNKFSTYTEPYANNMFKSSDEDCTKEVGWNALLYTLSGLFAIQTTAFCFTPVFAGKIPIYIALLSLTWVSMGVQSAALALLVEYKHKPLKEFSNANEKLIEKPSIKNFVDYIKKVGEEDYLCRANSYNAIRKGSTSEKGTYLYNFEQFKEKFGDSQTFLTKILPEIDKFQTMLSDDDWKEFVTDIQESDCSPSKFDEAMKEWGKKGVFTITNWTCTAVQLVTDATCIGLMLACPEMRDWQLMKEARLYAEEAGESTQYVIETYKTLAKIKSLRQGLLEASQQAMMKALRNERLASQVEERFLESCNSATGELKTFDSYWDVLEKQYSEWFDFVKQYRSSGFAIDLAKRQSFVGDIEHLINAEHIGLSKMDVLFSSRITRDGELISKMDELGTSLASRFIKDLNFAIRPSAEYWRSSIGLDRTFRAMTDFFHDIPQETANILRSTLNAAGDYIREGKVLECTAALKRFDEEIIKIAKNWINNPAAKAYDVAKKAQLLQDVLDTPFQWVVKFVDELRHTVQEGSGCLFAII